MEESIFELEFNRNKFSPQIVWLEPETLDEARFMSHQTINEANQWSRYLNTLALDGFEKWLKERRPNAIINKETNLEFENICFLYIGEYRLCLIVVDKQVDDVVNIPVPLLTSNNNTAHFYVLVEVVEEEEQVNLHGFLRYDLLTKYFQQGNITLQIDGNYELALSSLDGELKNLLQYISFLAPSAIKLPAIKDNHNNLIEQISENINKTKTQLNRNVINLNKWFDGVIESGWNSTKYVWDSIPNNLSWGSVRGRKELQTFSISQSKVFDFGILLQNKNLTLTINLKEEENQEKEVLVQVLPYEERILPPNLTLKVTLNHNTLESISQEVRTRDAYNAIQLQFQEKIGSQFKVEVSYKDAVLVEEFII